MWYCTSKLVRAFGRSSQPSSSCKCTLQEVCNTLSQQGGSVAIALLITFVITDKITNRQARWEAKLCLKLHAKSTPGTTAISKQATGLHKSSLKSYGTAVVYNMCSTIHKNIIMQCTPVWLDLYLKLPKCTIEFLAMSLLAGVSLRRLLRMGLSIWPIKQDVWVGSCQVLLPPRFSPKPPPPWRSLIWSAPYLIPPTKLPMTCPGCQLTVLEAVVQSKGFQQFDPVIPKCTMTLHNVAFVMLHLDLWLWIARTDC